MYRQRRRKWDSVTHAIADLNLFQAQMPASNYSSGFPVNVGCDATLGMWPKVPWEPEACMLSEPCVETP